MSLNEEQIRGVAKLAHLALKAEDVPRYTSELSGIMTLVEKLSSAPTEGIEPMAHPLSMIQRLRPDAVTESNQRERYQQLAPKVEDEVYLVPRVIE